MIVLEQGIEMKWQELQPKQMKMNVELQRCEWIHKKVWEMGTFGQDGFFRFELVSSVRGLRSILEICFQISKIIRSLENKQIS